MSELPDWVFDGGDGGGAAQARAEAEEIEARKRRRAVRRYGAAKRRKGEDGGCAGDDDDEPFLLRDPSAMGQGLDGGEDGDEDDDDSDLDVASSSFLRDLEPVQILFASRTHSQLAQVASELRHSKFGKTTKFVSLGSRQSLCINPQVSSLGSAERINDRCLDLQRESSAAKRCSFRQDDKLSASLRDLALAEIMDIEDLAKRGKAVKACPYYAGRDALPAAHIVALPYQSLLHAKTRETLGIEVSGSILIIDEAHNLVSALNDIHTARLSLAEVRAARRQVEVYLARYSARLAPANLVSVMLLENVVTSLDAFLAASPAATVAEVLVFLQLAKIENVNLFELARFMETSEISKKVRGFVEAGEPEGKGKGVGKDGGGVVSPFVHALRNVEAFLQCLILNDADGRVVIESQPQQQQQQPVKPATSLKYILLNPALKFSEVASQARAVVLAGGTMSPLTDLEMMLFPHLSPGRVSVHTNGHVIPASNLLCLGLVSAPNGSPLHFTYATREDHRMIDGLAMTLMNLCAVVPAGIVVFFPSYRHEEAVLARWAETKALDGLNKRKRVFREVRDKRVDDVLIAYTRHIESGQGAILTSVVGGKLSEGINFKDDLARCVVMVGLPFPNRDDPELKAKIAYLDEAHPGLHRGAELLETMTMKAVNQAIGRAVRHAKDYAVIVLADQRYSQQPTLRSKLPGWIAGRATFDCPFPAAQKATAEFFKQKKE